MYSEGGVLLTSTGDVIEQWKEYAKYLLNVMNTSSIEEAVDSEVDSLITGAGVGGGVRKLHDDRALGADERHLEFLEALDVVGLSWLTCLRSTL